MAKMSSIHPENIVHADDARMPNLAGIDFLIDSLVSREASTGREFVGVKSRKPNGHGWFYRTMYLSDILEDCSHLARTADESAMTPGMTVVIYDGVFTGAFTVESVGDLDPSRYMEMDGRRYRGHYRTLDLVLTDAEGVRHDATVPVSYIGVTL